MKKNTVTAIFPNIGEVEISRERANQILRLQKIILKDRQEIIYRCRMKIVENKKEGIKKLQVYGVDPIEKAKLKGDLIFAFRGDKKYILNKKQYDTAVDFDFFTKYDIHFFNY